MEDLKEFNGTYEEFVSNIGFGIKNAGYLKKKYAKAITVIYWEDYDRTKEKWFMNIIDIKKGKVDKKDGVWVIEKDLMNHLNHIYKNHTKHFPINDE